MRPRTSPKRKTPSLGQQPWWDSRAFAALVPLLLGLLCLIVYIKTFNVPFILDDQDQIAKREAIREIWPIWKPMAAQWSRATLLLSLAFNYSISQLEVWSYHVFNLSIHILAAVTLYALLRRTLLTDRLRDRFGYHAPLLAALAAAMWAVHPLNTSAVTYVVQRCESMMALSYMLTLYCVARACQSKRAWLWYVAAVAVCAFGMGAKQPMVTAPVVAFMYAAVFHGGVRKAASRWPLWLGLAATWAVLTPSLLKISTADTAGFGMAGMTWWQYGMTQFGVVTHYLKLVFVPHPLCLDYAWPVTKSIGDVWPQAIFISALVAASGWALFRRPAVGFAAAAFFIILSPSSSILPIRDVAFEFRMYLPLAALLSLLVLGGYRLAVMLSRPRAASHGDEPADASSHDKPRRSRWPLVGGAIVAGMAVVALALTSYLRNLDYRTEESIWRQTLQIAPHNARVHSNLGVVLLTRLGTPTPADPEGPAKEGLMHLRLAVQYDPKFFDAYYNLGVMASWRRDELRKQALPPNKPRPANAGELLNEASYHARESALWYEKGLRADPYYGKILFNYAILSQEEHQLDRAVELFGRMVKATPDSSPAYTGLATATALAGQASGDMARQEQSLAIFEKALDLDGENMLAFKYYYETLKTLRRPDEAARVEERAYKAAARGGTVDRKLFYEAFERPDASSLDPSRPPFRTWWGQILAQRQVKQQTQKDNATAEIAWMMILGVVALYFVCVARWRPAAAPRECSMIK